MHTVTESIWTGKNVIIALADVQHIETGNPLGLVVVTKHTRWDKEGDFWANSIWIDGAEASAFKAAWCRYRSELEADDLSDLSPNELVRDNAQFGVGA
jgi:hypothetical protein